MNIYDFDETIYDSDSTKDFYFYCLKKYPKILVKAVVELGCDSQTLEYQFFFQICPKIYSEKEKINNKLKQELIKKNEKANDSTLVLPESIDDQTIIWKEKSERMPLRLLYRLLRYLPLRHYQP